MKLIGLALVAAAVWAQESKLSVSDPSWQGVQIRFLTKVEPSPANVQSRLPGAIVMEHGRAHHIINDAAHKRTFGYDLWVDPEPGADSIQLRIAPMKFADGKPFSVTPGWTLIELPRYPVIPKVKIGETVALDLLVNPRTGQKVVDYLTVSRQPISQQAAPAKDFALADVELSLSRPQVNANGKLVAGTAAGTAGQVVWLYLPGHGRFSLSLFPETKRGFTRNGTATAGTFIFRHGSIEYRVECAGPVAPGSGRYNIYTRYEPDWYPGPENTFLIGSNARNAHLTIRKSPN